MYYVNKIICWIFSPLGMLFIGIVAARGLYIWSWHVARNSVLLRRLSVIVSVSVLVFTWVMGCGITTRILGASLEKDWESDGKAHGDIVGLSDADAIVVLGGGMSVHPKCKTPEMHGSADRVWQGARLYKAGKAELLTLSGPDVDISTVPLMEDLGVCRDKILLFPSARNTEEEADCIYKMLSQIITGRSPRVLLVTSAWHMRRAKLLFEKAGFNVVPAPTDFEMSCVLEGPIRISDFFPSSEAMSRNSYALKEWIGSIGYKFLGAKQFAK